MKLLNVQDEVNKVIRGKEEVVERVLAAVISGGHILMEDIPGVGKTTLATTFAKALSLDYKRVQFTPDVLPSDILGFSMYNAKQGDFEYRPGAIFCNLFLADEINRTSPKTQSALLEVMEENHATVDGVTRELPDPFVVIATENPIGSSGTQMLPESQLDRFMICVSMGYPAHEDAIAILKGESANLVSKVQPVLSEEELREIRKATEEVFVHDSIYDYIVELVEETRRNPLFDMGASPRATIALLRIARAMSILGGRDYVTAQDVQKILKDVLGHRVKLSARTRAERLTMEDAVRKLVQQVKVPRT
ncbi:MAG: MoxR family ATPase [Lachnospiraceae bacterium]|nr:MoxR family ATPase [Lachnospiraceae bacterium]